MKPTVVVYGVQRTTPRNQKLLEFSSSDYAKCESELERIWCAAEPGDVCEIVRVDGRKEHVR